MTALHMGGEHAEPCSRSLQVNCWVTGVSSAFAESKGGVP